MSLSVWVAFCYIMTHNLPSKEGDPTSSFNVLERWLSGRKRRFAKSVKGSNPSAGSNPVRSA